MNQSEANNSKNTLTEAAWEKLQKQLATEPVNAQWARWSKQGNVLESNLTADVTQNESTASETDNTHETTGIPLYSAANETLKKGSGFSWLRRNRKWLTGAVAASVLGFTLFTSVGNEALASILNKFRMEEITVVQEDDVQQIMNNVFSAGRSDDAANKFGSFAHVSGTLNGEYTLTEAEKLLNRKLVMPKEADSSRVNIQPSSKITLNLHVDEVNKALKQLGAKKLLPQSLDGKPITLVFGETAGVSRQVQLNSEESSYYFQQMAVPSIEVDPSIPVEEAVDAVLQFPFIPEYIKDSLKNSGVLDNGNLPLPVITNGSADKRTIEGVEVVMTQNTYNYHRSNGKDNVEEIYYELTWVKQDQVYHLSGTGFTDANEAFALAKELIMQ